MYIGSFLYFRTWLRTAFTSICCGSSKAPANVQRKYFPFGHLLLRRCDNRRPLMLNLSLVLLPIYTGILLASPIIYMPIRPSEILRIFSRVNSYHLFSTGIINLQNFISIISIIVNTQNKIRERGWRILPIAFGFNATVYIVLSYEQFKQDDNDCHCAGRNRYIDNHFHCYTPLIPHNEGRAILENIISRRRFINNVYA